MESKAASMSKEMAIVYCGVSVRVFKWVSTRVMAASAVILLRKPYWCGERLGVVG